MPDYVDRPTDDELADIEDQYMEDVHSTGASGDEDMPDVSPDEIAVSDDGQADDVVDITALSSLEKASLAS